MQFEAEFVDALLVNIESRKLPPAPRPPVLPSQDYVESEIPAEIGYAEGQSFMIEYVSSTGEHSSRRITVWGISTGAGGVPTLVATCHERRAPRTFRVDRIRAVIDYSGEVHQDVPTFLQRSFGMSLEYATKTTDPVETNSWSRFRDANSSHLTLFVALSKADYILLPEEVGVIADWAKETATRQGISVSSSFLDTVQAYVRRLRPTEANVERSVNRLTELSPPEVVSLLSTAVHLMDADGERHGSELSLLNHVSEQLTGLPLIEA